MMTEKPFYLCSREYKPDLTVLDLEKVTIGAQELLIIAGPCAVESEEQMFATAAAVKAAGGHGLRGGLFKPRTSPYSFQGLGMDGLDLLVQAAQEYGLLTITEVMDLDHLDILADSVDILQVGSRNMQKRLPWTKKGDRDASILFCPLELDRLMWSVTSGRMNLLIALRY